MWEAIAANRRRSAVLVVLMGLLLVGLGGLLGAAFVPRGGGVFGALIAAGVWLILWTVALFQGENILLHTAGASRVTREDHPQLWNVVEEMTIASGLGTPPEIYVIADEAPNAFAVGRHPKKRAVAVTTGLLRVLTRDELQGVVAHEIGHLRNRDTSFMVLMGVMLGAIVMIAEIFLRLTRHSGRSRGSSRGGGGGGHAVLLIIAILAAILAPFLAQMMYLACSRRREYLADASGALFTRYPEGLASALEKISTRPSAQRETNRVLAPMYIVNPMQALAFQGLFSTHPPADRRIRILRGMAGGAGLAMYEAAFRQVTAQGECLGKRTLAEAKPVAVREASSAKEDRKSRVDRAHEVIQLLGRMDNLIMMTCSCGVGVKVPPELDRPSVPCPRCGNEIEVPFAGAARDAATPEVTSYRRRSKGWETFKCGCGAPVHLSPDFIAPMVSCRGCKRQIEVVS